MWKRVLVAFLVLFGAFFSGKAFASVMVTSPDGQWGCEAYTKAESREQWGERNGHVVLCFDGSGQLAGYVLRKNGAVRCTIHGELEPMYQCGWLQWCGELASEPCE